MDNIELATKTALIRGDITDPGIVDKTRTTETWKLITLRNSAGKTLSKIPVSRVAELRDQGTKFSAEEENKISKTKSVIAKGISHQAVNSQRVTAIATSLIALVVIGVVISQAYKAKKTQEVNKAISACSNSRYFESCMKTLGYQLK